MQSNNKQINNDPDIKENKEIIKIMRESLIKLKASNIIVDNNDVESLGKYIKSKEIIGLGEATHGTKEFQNMRTRILAYLISNLGFRNIILEESYCHCLKINSYILNGEGTAEDAVKEGLYFPWVFKTKETVALVKWLREYNILADENNKVRFYGMDFQGAQKAIEVIAFYIKKVDNENYNKIKIHVDIHLDRRDTVDFRSIEDSISIIDKIFVDNRTKYIKATCEREYAETYRCIDIYKQWTNSNKNGNTFNIRDRYMFENTKWIIENSKKYGNGRIVIIAHNDHIQKGIAINAAECRQLGFWLNEEYKQKYYNIGFEFSRGLFYSFDMNDDYKLKVFEVDKSTKHDLAARLFEAVNIPAFFLDLISTAEGNMDFLNFISSINRYNSIGAVYDNTKDDFGIDSLALKDMYNAILYIKDSNNTTPLNI